MPENYPYIISNNKIDPIFARIRSAAKPARFTTKTLKDWGFTASNDRAMLTVLKDLGFLTEAGGPTEYYDRLRDPNQWRHVLGERMRDLYADLFAIDTNIQEAPDTEVKGAMARVTGQGDEAVKRYYATFKALASLARFDAAPTPRHPAEEQQEGAAEVQRAGTPAAPDHEAKRRPDFHYNIQIHLPVTTDITVYNAIFRSLRDTLNI